MNKSKCLDVVLMDEKFSSWRLENPSWHFPHKRCEKVQRPVAQIGWSQNSKEIRRVGV